MPVPEIDAYLRNVTRAAGDLIYRSVAGAIARLPIGSAGQHLAVNATADGVEWVDPAAAGGMEPADVIAGTGISVTPDTPAAGDVTIASTITQYADADAVAAVAAADDYLSNAGDTGAGNYVFTGTLESQTSPLTLAAINLIVGAGTPEGVVAAPVGSFYLRTDGAGGTTGYLKESGAGNTGWAAIAPGGGGYTDEQVRDVMGTALVPGTGIAITPNDVGDTITIDATGGGGYTDAEAVAAVAAADDYLLNTGDTGVGAYALKGDNAVEFAVQKADATNVLVVKTDAANKLIEGRNGAVLIMSTDDGVTQWFKLDGATFKLLFGAPFDVNLYRGAADVLRTDDSIEASGAITSRAVVTKTAAYTATAADQVILCDASGGAFTITLPALASVPPGKTYTIVKIDDQATAVTIDGNGAETINGSTTAILNNVTNFSALYKFITIVKGATEWSIVAHNRMLNESGGTVQGSVDFGSGGTLAFQFRNGSSVRLLVIDGTNNEIELRNGADLRIFSDDGTTEKASIDGATGNIQTDGSLTTDLSSTAAVNFRENGTNRIKINTTAASAAIDLMNGSDLALWSDDGATLIGKWFGDSGNFQTDGTVNSDADFLIGANSILVTPIIFVIDGGGSAITTGIKGDIPIPFKCQITGVRLLADQSGSIVVDLWKDTYANFPPVVGDTITAAAKPTLSAAAKSEDTTLTGWTTTVNAGDILRVNVDSAATVQRVTLALTVKRIA